MSEYPSFPFYPTDFLGGRVATYDLEEIGAFSLLLAFDWTLNGLPTEPERLAKLCRISTRRFRKIWGTISEQFPERNGRRCNARLVLERERKAAKSAEATRAASMRWQCDRNADASIVHAESDATTTLSPALEVDQVVVDSDVLIKLVTAANKGLAEHVRAPQAIPRILPGQGTAVTAARAMLRAGVPLEFAESHVYQLARTHSASETVQSLGYFRAAVIRAWQERVALDDAASSGSIALPKRAERRVTAARMDGGRATLLFGRIMKLADRQQQPGQAEVRFIPRVAVETLGSDVLEAYEAVGGAKRFLAVEPEQIGFLIRDFQNALGASQAGSCCG